MNDPAEIWFVGEAKVQGKPEDGGTALHGTEQNAEAQMGEVEGSDGDGTDREEEAATEKGKMAVGPLRRITRRVGDSEGAAKLAAHPKSQGTAMSGQRSCAKGAGEGRGGRDAAAEM